VPELVATCQVLSQTPQCIRFQFDGRFAGRPVVWDVTLLALGRQGGEQYLEVGAARQGIQPIRVGLLLDRVDQSCMLKTRVMIENYKNLRPGRHEFAGPAKRSR